MFEIGSPSEGKNLTTVLHSIHCSIQTTIKMRKLKSTQPCMLRNNLRPVSIDTITYAVVIQIRLEWPQRE